MNAHATLPEFVMEPMIVNASAGVMTMTGLDMNMSQMQQTLYIADTSALKTSQRMSEQDVNTDLSEMKLTALDFQEVLPEIELTKQNTDASLADMGPMVHIEESEPIPEQKMAHIELNVEHSPVDVSQNKLEKSEHTVADRI